MADRQELEKSGADTVVNEPNQKNGKSKTKRKYNRRKHRQKRSVASSVESNKTQEGNIHEKNTQLDNDNENAQNDNELEHKTNGVNNNYDQLGARPKSATVFEQPSYDNQSNSTGWNMVDVNSNVGYSHKSRTPEKRNVLEVQTKDSEEVTSRRQLADYPIHDKSQLLVQNSNEDETYIDINIKSNVDKELNNDKNSKQIQLKTYNDNVTDLYIVIHETFSSLSDIKRFLLRRMGNPIFIDFDVIEVTETIMSAKQGCTLGCVAHIRFESNQKWLVAKQLLNLSNTNATSDVSCHYELGEADDEQNESEENEEREEPGDVLTEIYDEVRSMHDIHNQKIRFAAKKLEDIQQQLNRHQGVPLVEFEKLSNENDAWVDKLKELDGQKSEFYNYVENMYDKLGNHQKCDNKLNEVQKSFDIECQRLLSALPIYAKRTDILTTVTENQVCVILGETGSGKSTQIAQYIYEAGFAANGMIVCAQPSKFAAISLATKVSSELDSSVGQIVGYKVGMQSKTTAATKVIYMTDTILLNECLSDRELMRYSCIIIDEAHERSIHTDLLLGMLKQCLERRPELRVIITSTTIDAQMFVDYFEGRCPVLKVSGRTFPVDVIWNQDDYIDSPFPEDYEEKALRKAIELHTTMPIDAGDILVFLTDASETEKAVEEFKKRIGEKDAHCFQLHDCMEPEEQQSVLAPTPTGRRKVVFATNNAETSLTIPGITFVIDCGVGKEMVFDPKTKINPLSLVRISQSSANQRKGRAGRTRPGLCYRLYTDIEFNEMEIISKPEILRVRISQVILKLMDFGIDPMEFKYVQAPSVDSMKSALDELTQLGAVVDNCLTDLGKWISKVPLEPRLGALVKNGIGKDVLLEVLVVAACISQPGLVFRVGAQDGKNVADMKMVRFCHFGGDLLTMLNVYREWDQTNEKKKDRWCVDNCINGKSLKAVRDMVNEITLVLRKENNMQIKHYFGNPETVDPVVQRLICECMTSNLGYFLGYGKSGFVITECMPNVRLHPSSSILSLGRNPTWIVFSQALQTTADFLTDATPVPESYVLKVQNAGQLSVDVHSIKRHKVRSSFKVSVGRHVFWKFVGCMHANRQKVEDQISKACENSMVVIEANKQKGEITLFSVPEYEHIASTVLQSLLNEMTEQLHVEYIEEMTEQLLLESIEEITEPLLLESIDEVTEQLLLESRDEQLLLESREEMIGNGRNGIRAVIGSGGRVCDVLMPNEFRSFNILKKDGRVEINENEITDMLGFYGPVENIRIASGEKQRRQCWGNATFTHSVDAEAAVNYINEDEDSEIYTMPLTYENQTPIQTKQEFTMKLTWWRRKARGHCYVHLSNPEDEASLVSKYFELDGSEVTIKLANNNNGLHLKGIGPETMEVDIKDCLAKLLGLSDDRCIKLVVIPRHDVTWTESQKSDLEKELSLLISNLTHTPEDKFRVQLRDFKPKTVKYVASVKFDDQNILKETGERLIDNNARINGSYVHVKLEYKTTVNVDENLYPIVAPDLDELIDNLNRSSSCIEIKRLRSGAVVLNINASSANHLARVKVRINRVVDGDILDCENQENLHILFRSSGRLNAKIIEQKTKTMIYFDDRNMQVTLKGSSKGRKDALTMIHELISSYDNSVEKIVRLKEDNLPICLMKAVLMKYGVDFKKLLDETGVTRVQLNLRHHEMKISGADKAVDKASETIESLRKEMTTEPIIECGAPDCPICLCPVTELDISRLEYCRHAYCSVCLISMIQNSVINNEFPVHCAREGCDQPLVVRDFDRMIKIGKLKPSAFLDAALACFIACNKDTYRFCITPGCAMVYRVSLKPDRELFVCPVCLVQICASCHSPYHDGITCAMYKSVKDDIFGVENYATDI